MALPRKTRNLRLADGGIFRIGAGTVTVHVSTMPLDPPAVLLHVNRSCGALELEPDEHGHTLPPVRVDAARVLEIVGQVNSDRATAAMRGERAEPPVELPPTFTRTAKHVAVWKQRAFPFMVHDGAVGYPSKLPTEPDTTLWVKRDTGACVLEVIRPPSPPGMVRMVDWVDVTPRRAVDWLAEHGYRAIPATLHQRLRAGGKGAADAEHDGGPRKGAGG